jgi:hypothetical protein
VTAKDGPFWPGPPGIIDTFAGRLPPDSGRAFVWQLPSWLLLPRWIGCTCCLPSRQIQQRDRRESSDRLSSLHARLLLQLHRNNIADTAMSSRLHLPRSRWQHYRNGKSRASRKLVWRGQRKCNSLQPRHLSTQHRTKQLLALRCREGMSHGRDVSYASLSRWRLLRRL